MSIKKKCIANLTTEAEYIVACKATKEAIWLKKFLMELEVVPALLSAITLYCDNSGTVAQSKEPRKRKARREEVSSHSRHSPTWRCDCDEDCHH